MKTLAKLPVSVWTRDCPTSPGTYQWVPSLDKAHDPLYVHVRWTPDTALAPGEEPILQARDPVRPRKYPDFPITYGVRVATIGGWWSSEPIPLPAMPDERKEPCTSPPSAATVS